MNKVKDAIIEDFEKSMEAWRGLATKDNMFLIGRIDAYEMAIAIVKYMFDKVGTGHWTGMEGDTCSECGRNLTEIMDADSYFAIGFDPSDLVACPFCGVRMIKKKEGGE